MSSARKTCVFRFHDELNDFLPSSRRSASFEHHFDDTPTVKDRIESLGIPHTEVELILVDGLSVDFRHRLHGGEQVHVYSHYQGAGGSSLIRLRSTPPGEPRFVLDVHLGRLAALLRLLGFDCAYRNDLDDATIIDMARMEQRIVLTRDIGILKHGSVHHGAFVHATVPIEQVRETIERFQLWNRLRPFARCMSCNGALEAVPAAAVADRVPPTVRSEQSSFSRCRTCGRVYWPGGHIRRLRQRMAMIGIEL